MGYSPCFMSYGYSSYFLPAKLKRSVVKNSSKISWSPIRSETRSRKHTLLIPRAHEKITVDIP